MSEHPCLGCKFAEWKRTAAGRLHPSKDGKCVWTSPQILPASLGDYDRERIARELNRPRYIERDKWPMGECTTREQGEPHV